MCGLGICLNRDENRSKIKYHTIFYVMRKTFMFKGIVFKGIVQ